MSATTKRQLHDVVPWSLPADERRAAIIDAVVPLLREFGEAVTCRRWPRPRASPRAPSGSSPTRTNCSLAAFEREVDQRTARSIDPQDRPRPHVRAAADRGDRTDAAPSRRHLDARLQARARCTIMASGRSTIPRRSPRSLATDGLLIRPGRCRSHAARFTFSLTHPMLASEQKPAARSSPCSCTASSAAR